MIQQHSQKKIKKVAEMETTGDFLTYVCGQIIFNVNLLESSEITILVIKIYAFEQF